MRPATEFRQLFVMLPNFALGVFIAFLLQNQVTQHTATGAVQDVICTATVTGASAQDGVLTFEPDTNDYSYSIDWEVGYDCSSGDTSACFVCTKSSTYTSSDGEHFEPSSSDSSTSDQSECGKSHTFGLNTSVTNMQPNSWYAIQLGVKPGSPTTGCEGSAYALVDRYVFLTGPGME